MGEEKFFVQKVSYTPEPRQKKFQEPATSGSGDIAKKRAFTGKKKEKKNNKRKRKERKHVRCYMSLFYRKRDIINRYENNSIQPFYYYHYHYHYNHYQRNLVYSIIF